MNATVHSIAGNGEASSLIDVECNLSNGLPNIIIVGLANKAVDEAKERVRSAFSNSELDLPRKRITINLAPADLPKESSSFDLAIAAAILTASGQAKGNIENRLVIGELGLNGSVRPIRGIIGSLLAGTQHGRKLFYIPEGNLGQAQLVPHVTLLPVKSLRDLYLDLTNTVPIKPIETGKGLIEKNPPRAFSNDFKFVIGQRRAKRAMEIAAAGAHNILLNGPPGTGKSMLAKALPTILAPLELDEILEITHLHSLATRQYDRILTDRPFRAPHHSASEISIVGGGQRPRPGEVSLSHRGVLFLDEFPEFSRSTIESLRQPLEDKIITVTRARDSITFPADFILVATANPCPCGYYGTTKPCSCLPAQIVKYQRKLSGPILDRIDMHIEVEEVRHQELLKDSREESSEEIRKRITKARQRQYERFNHPSRTNASLSNQEIKKLVKLSAEAEELLNKAAERLGISPRSYMRLIKVARTIADLEISDSVESPHITEALQYRRQPNLL